jgi:hypothetical protein
MTGQADKHDTRKDQREGGREGDPGHLGGASKGGHLSPRADVKGGKAEGGGQIAQDSQQSSGQGSGQS